MHKRRLRLWGTQLRLVLLVRARRLVEVRQREAARRTDKAQELMLAEAAGQHLLPLGCCRRAFYGRLSLPIRNLCVSSVLKAAWRYACWCWKMEV